MRIIFRETIKIPPDEVVFQVQSSRDRITVRMTLAAPIDQPENGTGLLGALIAVPGFAMPVGRDLPSLHYFDRLGLVHSSIVDQADWFGEALDSTAAGTSFPIDVRGFPVPGRGDHSGGAP